MLIYLDANLVQYCADYEEFIFGNSSATTIKDAKLRRELTALRRLVEIEQLGTDWSVAAPLHLMKELLAGIPRPNQLEVYRILLEAWRESDWQDFIEASEDRFSTILHSLDSLHMEHRADKRHLAEAIVLGAQRFLTNDKDVIKKTRRKSKLLGNVQGVWVARPSECIEQISRGLFLR